MGGFVDWVTGRAKAKAEAERSAAEVHARQRAAEFEAFQRAASNAREQAEATKQDKGQPRPGEKWLPEHATRMPVMFEKTKREAKAFLDAQKTKTPDPKPREEEATRMKYSPDRQPGPSMNGPGVTFVNPLASRSSIWKDDIAKARPGGRTSRDGGNDDMTRKLPDGPDDGNSL